MNEIDTERQRILAAGFRKLEELDSLDDQVSAEFLLECLAHPSRSVRGRAIERIIGYRRHDFTWILAVALNDRWDGVVEAAAQALAKINTDEALVILNDALFEGGIERPHHIANAISQFGQRGFDVLLKGTESPSPNIRYYSAKLLGSVGLESAREILEKMAEDDQKTSFGGMVSTAARKGLKTLSKILENKTR